MDEKRLEKIERMLKWIIWRFTDGENFNRLMKAPKTNNPKHEEKKEITCIKFLNSEPNIDDVYIEIARKEK